MSTVAPKAICEITNIFAGVIADAINMALHGVHLADGLF